VISIRINVTLALHAKLSLSRDHQCKTHVNQRLFSYVVFIKERFTSLLTRDHISENQYGEITSEYRFGVESLVTMTFLLSQCIESRKMTRVPSPIISMAKRTALCLSIDSLRKQVTSNCLKNKQRSGLCTYRLGAFFKKSNPVRL